MNLPWVDSHGWFPPKHLRIYGIGDQPASVFPFYLGSKANPTGALNHLMYHLEKKIAKNGIQSGLHLDTSYGL